MRAPSLPSAATLLFLLFAFSQVASVQGQSISLGEALDTNLVWTTGGDTAWFGQATNSYDGVSAAGCLLSGVGKESWLETTVEGPATLSFWSEETDWTTYPQSSTATLVFALNPNSGPGGPGAPYSGTFVWENHVYDLGAGTNVLRWSFQTFPWASNATAIAFVDQVAIEPPRPLQFVYGPAGETLLSRDTAWLTSYAIGTPPLSYQWYKDGASLAGATNALFYLPSVTTNDTGEYWVVVTNSQGSVVSTNALLTVLPPSPPSIPYQLYDQTVYVGEWAGWSVYASGSPPLAYQWLKNGNPIGGATNYSLLINDVQLSDAGSYSVLVTNTEGIAVSSNAVLAVLPSSAPVITLQPCSMNVAAGASPELTVHATGAPDPVYQWLRNGTNIPGARYSSLSFSNITAASAGVYSVIVNNFVGRAISQPAILAVRPGLSATGSWFQAVDNVFVAGELAYLSQGADGIGVLSLSNAPSPVMLGGFNTAGGAVAVRVAGDLAYVADGFSGLAILSVTNPAEPVAVGHYESPGYAQDVFVAGGLAYIADGDAGLEIVDVSDPAHPALLGNFVTNMSAACVNVAGNYAYVGCPAVVSVIGGPVMTDGMQILDVSDPARPVLVGLTTQDTSGLDVVVNVAVTAGLNSGVTVFDISDRTNPAAVGSYLGALGIWRPRLFAQDVELWGNLAFVAAGSNGLCVLDLSVPSAPVNVANFAAEGYAEKVSVAANRAYLALGDGGLQIIDIPAGLGIQPAPGLSIAWSGGLKLKVEGPVGAQFWVEYCDALPSGAWQAVQEVTLTNGPVLLNAPISGTGSRFFRARPVFQD